MDFVVPIITPVVESLMGTLKKHLGFLISSRKHVKNMDAKMKQLKDIAKEVEVKRDTADANTEVVPERVERWLEDVKMMNERVKSISTLGTGCFNVPRRYKDGKQSFDILKEIEDLETRETKIKFTKEKISLAKVRSTSTQSSTSALVLNGTQNNFVSRDMVFNDALKSLQPINETQKMIALCGIGGVGKTTMMEQLKKVVEDSKMFDWVVKVAVGENKGTIALQQAIAEYIREGLTETTIDARAERLRKAFEGMSKDGHNKILIIMDDVWKEVDLKDIGLASPLPNGFKILFTSRYENVCTRMGVKVDSIFKVGVLSDAEAKSLFFGVVGPPASNGDDPELHKIGEDIVKKCGGLPIALKTIANNLRDNIKDAWKEALYNLQHNDLQDLDDIVHKVFEMSYNYLKKEDDKAIFLLSGLFPDDFNIPIEDLMMYGWGLMLFTKVHNLGEARRRTNICVNNLIRANLLTKSEVMGCVKMHDLARAFALSNFSKVKQASILNHDGMSQDLLTKDSKEPYERILLNCKGMSEIPDTFNYPNLSLLILMGGGTLKFPEDIYERMEKLEVVSYEKMNIPLLPVKFQHSTKLRTLCLRSCSGINDDISFLGNLCNLEILSFADSGIKWLPSTIGKLKKLKVLDLTGCVHLCIDDGVFQNLDSLEELYMRAHTDSPIRFTPANCDELEKLSQGLFALELEFFSNNAQPKNVSFKTLKRFRISIGCKLLELRHDEKYSFRNTIQLVGACNEFLEGEISDLFEKTDELHLQVNDMNHLEDVSMHHSFSNLTVLHVSKCADLTYLFTVDVASGLKKLERLTISDCGVLRTLVDENSRVGVIRFDKLTCISLKCLPKMVSLWDNVIEFPEMVELILDDLPNFTSIYPQSHNTSEIHSLLNKKVVVPKLEKLAIYRMENLTQIWSCETITKKSYVSAMRQIEVRECHNLMNLFPNNPFPLVNHLEELEVGECGSIEVLFNMDFESVCGTEGSNSNRLRSIRVDNLRKLKELWRMKGVNNSNVLINCFKGVEIIELRNCSIFENIFTPITANFNLGGLIKYKTENTGEEKNAILKGEISEIHPGVTYPSYLLHNCHHLQHLALYEDEHVGEVVFEMDSQPPILCAYLSVLSLYNLNETSHVWKCNWNKFLIPQCQPLQLPFQNLKDISLQSCHKIKYLFSPLMAKYLSNLNLLHIIICDGIEEVISSRDDENEENLASTSSYESTTLFPCLEILKLAYLNSLKSIDGNDGRCRSDKLSSKITNTIYDQSQMNACWSLCQYPKEMYIFCCDGLSSLIPWYVVGQMKRLEYLEIKDCRMMTEVFESESINKPNDNGTLVATGTTLTSPTLQISTIVVAPQLSNLETVCIYDCNLLQHIFTFSTLESLKQLKELTVERCEAMQVIVKQESGMSPEDVVFPRLKSLELDDLPNLKSFFSGMNDFRWPLLDKLMIKDCPQLMKLTCGESKVPKLHTNNLRQTYF